MPHSRNCPGIFQDFNALHIFAHVCQPCHSKALARHPPCAQCVHSPVLTANHLSTSCGIETANVTVRGDLTSNRFRSASITIACRRVAIMQSFACSERPYRVVSDVSEYHAHTWPCLPSHVTKLYVVHLNHMLSRASVNFSWTISLCILCCPLRPTTTHVAAITTAMVTIVLSNTISGCRSSLLSGRFGPRLGRVS